MKHLFAAALGLILTSSLAPTVQAQSLNFGSLGGAEAEQPAEKEHWTKGIAYTIDASATRPSPGRDRCQISIDLDPLSALEVPLGRLGWVDHATGMSMEDETWFPFRLGVMLFPYPDSDQYVEPDFAGTTREMSFYIMEGTTDDRIEIGTLDVSFPRECPLPDQVNSLELERGVIAP